MKTLTVIVCALALLGCPKTSVELSSLTISPDVARMAQGKSIQFVATALFTDGEVRDVTAQARWSVDDAYVGTASEQTKGSVLGLAAGKTLVRARYEGRNLTRKLEVVDAELKELQLDPPHPVLPVGLGVAMKVTAIRTDGSTQDVTAEAVWSSSSPGVADLEQSTVIGLRPGALTITASVQGLVVSAPVDVTDARIEMIDVQPAAFSLPINLTRQLTATALLSDGSSLDVTAQAAWRSSAAQVAFVSVSAGVIAGRAAGSARITATILGASGASDVTVTAATLRSLELGPGIFALANGTSQPFSAIGTFSDGTTADLSSQVTWSSSDASVFTSAAGMVRALGVGRALLTASLGEVSVSRELQVTGATIVALELRPSPAVVARGLTLDATAIATFTDASQQDLTRLVLWRSRDLSMATVSNAMGSAGRVTGTSEGVTELTATLAGLTASTSLTVSAAALASVQITPSAPTLALGTIRAFTATGLFTDGTTQDLTQQATWSSTDPTRVAISSQGTMRGVAQAVGQGITELRATIGTKTGSTMATVSDAVLTSIEVSPDSRQLPLGVTARFVATGRFSDGSVTDVTEQATWSSSAPLIASVSNLTRGEVSSLSLGSTQLSAQLGTIIGETRVTVSAAAITALELSPLSATIATGLTHDFRAVATYSDGTTQDVTAQASFRTLAPLNATVIGGRVTAHAAGITTLVVTAMGFSAQAELTVTPAQLMGLTIQPGAITLARGTAGQLTVEVSLSDGTTAPVTTQVTWSSADSAIVSVSNAPLSQGSLTALTMGTTTVSAQLGNLTASSTVTVSAATLSAIEVTPTAASIPLGASQRFVATGRYTDGSAQDLSTQATWSSAAPLVLSLSNAPGRQGLSTTQGQGTAVVSATFGGMTGRTSASVTAATLAQVQLSPPAPRFAKDTRLAVRATGVWSDGATQDLTSSCTWSSATPAIATVSNASPGQVFGLAPGTATITALCAGVSGSVEVTITDAQLTSIELTPSAPTAAAGFTLALTATGRFSDGTTQPFSDFVSWASADLSKAQVSSAGLVSARAQGSVAITAQALSVTGSVNFVVSAAVLDSIELAPASVPKGLGQAFVALGHFSDGTTGPVSEAATWSSTNPAIATVSNAAGTRGQATALEEGVTTISATLSGLSARVTLTVTAATLSFLAVTPVNPSVAKGLSLQFTATGTFTDGTTRDLTTQVTWTSGAEANISNSDGTRGRALALTPGNTTVTATLGATTASTSLTVTAAVLVSIGVTPSSNSVPRGLSKQLTATGVYSDGAAIDLTNQLTWTSSDPSRAAVSNGAGSEGLVQALAIGDVVITAAQGAVSGTTNLTVTAAVLQQLVLTPSAPTLAAGQTTSLTATGLYSDSSTQDLTSAASWSSSDTSIATVAAGLVSGSRVGSATLAAQVGSVSARVTVTVTAAVLRQLQVTPQNASRPSGLSQQFVAMGVFSDGSTSDVTSTVTWSSSDASKLIVSNANGSRGLGNTAGVGTVAVSASLSSVTGSTPFTVTAAVLTSLTITPANSSASLGSVRQYVATGRYTDGSTQNLTGQVTWASSNTSVASISNANGSRGLATTLGTGSTSITAAFATFTASSNLVVIQNALTRIDLTPSSGGTALGYSRQFIAIGTYSDGTTQVLTNVVTWTTDDSSVAIVSNADGSRGLLSTVGTGNVMVSATHQGVTATAPHAVTPARLIAITLSPSSVSLAVGATAQLTATGSFSDGTTQDLSRSVTWSSSAQTIAQVSNAAGSEGLVSAIATGTAAISAAQGTVSASLNVTVN